MADSSRTIMTDAGFALETRVRADETKMQFTRAAISTDDHFSDTDDALAKLTELYNIQQDGKVTAVQVINTTTVYVQVDVNQAESKADYQMRSAALYAKDDDGTEVLYGVTVLQDPVFVHKDADGSYLGFGINTTVGKASNVVVVVDPANMVTQQVFEGTMKNYYTKAEVDAKFVTDDDFASKLPKNIATTDAANTFAKSQTLAGGATDGKGNAYATTKDVATGLNNGLSTKVTDNHDGTEQLNGVQVQPFNKLSDTIGGRNLLPGTSGTLQIVTNASGWNANLPAIIPVVTTIDSDTTYTARAWISPASHDINLQIVWQDSSGATVYRGGNTVSAGTSGYSTWTGTITAGSTIQRVAIVFGAQQSTPSSVSYKEMKLEQGSIATDWTPAPEDKVNVSDMRKPASDVAGIEEVNAKQDKIGYTPADDSKVLHSTITNLSGTDLNTMLTAGFFRVLNGLNTAPNSDNWTIYQIIPLSSNNGVQIAYSSTNNMSARRSWSLLGSIVFTSWVQFADDSKVAHLSGANNFDTLPTVNNNPLLLASSLPSDLARTGSDQEFKGKNTFDTAPIDKTTGNPYITKPDVTTAINAATANVVDRNPDTGVVSEPVDFTKLTVNGGKSVATSDDLKSLETSAWRQLDNQYVTRSADGKSFRKAGDDSSVLYKIDEEKKFIYFSFIIYNPDEVTLLDRIDFSSIVKNISFPGYSTFHISNISSGAGNSYYQMSIANNQIQISGSASSLFVSSVSAEYRKTSSSGWEYSRCFVSYDELV
ncbi:pyocin knob domain-containing protein [Levilactobacillus brevis]|uniref:pyocin knob domain-containing protein n=1 Tax=Levilactobacillus brevis TaxID=1580 RepID=UPI00117AA4FB|nr:pyocin knob domain-containing protein [Levilactobacillus brevis]MCZ2118646.1 pyocin knob domain-containing protein [Levilactobacillus brevis]MCZ2124170.1 pyocin knob domain-containing protein [Levilactobacillus brevis]MCZ2208490.1 pyocin knob domain-containing protein [Levilactobacillus brevis]MCZ2323954.1 pyocin knob domain-containing protein [Levilactobacillus brevis]